MSKIVINPGHYPDLDPGAIGPTGLQEVDVAMAVAAKLKALLAAAGHEVYMIQENDLADIVSQANQTGADLFVSIHCNGYSDSSACGTETWCYMDSQESYELAQEIQTELIDATELLNRGVKLSGGLYVIKHTVMPAVLVELAFITNPAEEVLLNDVDYQQTAAAAIAGGIEEYLAGN